MLYLFFSFNLGRKTGSHFLLELLQHARGSLPLRLLSVLTGRSSSGFAGFQFFGNGLLQSIHDIDDVASFRGFSV